jgi:hypothetical protein
MNAEAAPNDPAKGPVGVPPAGAHRVQATAAWAAWLLAVVSGLMGAVYVAADQATGHPVMDQTPVSGLAGAAIAATYGSVGLLLVLRRPGLVVGWLFVGTGVVAGLSNFAWGYVGLGATLGAAPGVVSVIEVAWLNNALTYSAWVSLSILLILLFPDGRPPAPAWRTAVWGTIVGSIVLAAALAVEPGPMRLFDFLDNPRPAPEAIEPLVGSVILLALGVLLLIGVLSVWGLHVRYRRGSTTERRQLRWFVWGASLTLAGGVVLVFAALATEADSRLVDASWVVFAVASITLPVAALIAILRERLYDIDRLISRTFVFGLLTAILAGLYAAFIRLFNAVFVGLTGESSELALVLTTLILATTFTPIKLRLEHVARSRLGTSEDGVSVAATDVLAGEVSATAGPASSVGGDLDRRIEAIARRVSLEVLAGSARTDGAAQDDQADQDQHERSEQVAKAGEPGP